MAALTRLGWVVATILTHVPSASLDEAEAAARAICDRGYPLAEVDKLREQRAAVLALHHLSPNAPAHDPYCWACSSDEGWPCDTARALGIES